MNARIHTLARLACAALVSAALVACQQSAPLPGPLNSPPAESSQPSAPDSSAPAAATDLPPVALTGTLVFAYDPGGTYQIGSLDLPGNQLRTLTSSPQPGEAEPGWSPDGSFIVFTSGRNRGLDFETYKMNADGSDQQVVIISEGAGGNYSPSVSPDGKKIVFHTNRDGNMEIYTANIDGSDQRNLTQNPASDSAASWSPDGSQIVFGSDRSGLYQLYTMSRDGGDARLLFDHPGFIDFRPRYSPNGSLVLFGTQTVTDSLGSGPYHLAVINADGTGFRFVTTGAGLNTQGNWIDDGTIVFSGRNSVTEVWQLFLIGADGAGRRQLTTGTANYRNPSWISR